MPFPTSELSLKIISAIQKQEEELKNPLLWVSKRTGDPQQQIQITDVNKFITKPMVHLSDY